MAPLHRLPKVRQEQHRARHKNQVGQALGLVMVMVMAVYVYIVFGHSQILHGHPFATSPETRGVSCSDGVLTCCCLLRHQLRKLQPLLLLLQCML